MEVDIVIIGAGLTGLTTGFHLTRRKKQILVLEQANRVGGQIHSYQKDGFVFESGPNTGVISYPEVAELFEALGDKCTLQTAHDEAKKRLIWKGSKFDSVYIIFMEHVIHRNLTAILHIYTQNMCAFILFCLEPNSFSGIR